MLQASLRGLDEIEKLFAGLNEAVDVNHILDEAGAILLNRILTRFRTQTAPDGSKWPESGASMHRRLIYGDRDSTLFDTGKLYRSIQLSADGPNGRKIGTDVEYGVDHNLGVNGQLQRVFLGFNQQDVQLVTALILKRIQKVTE